MRRDQVARIDEARCIGCTRCIDACPVDAIVGAAQLMHTVVDPWCIGCKLCLPACPVDCILLAPPRAPWTAELKEAARERAQARRTRTGIAQAPFVLPDAQARRAVIEAVLERKRAR